MKKMKTRLRNTLLEKVEEKKSLLVERRICDSRLKFVLENYKKTKDVEPLLIEFHNLKDMGIDHRVIEEGFWDMIKGMWGDAGSNIAQTIKERILNYIIKQLGYDPNHWVSELLKISFANIAISDIPKLTDCKFLSHKLSLDIAEFMGKKLQEKMTGGSSGVLGDMIRNSIFTALDKTALADGIQDGVASIICPMISNIGKKLDQQSTEMVKRAVTPS